MALRLRRIAGWSTLLLTSALALGIWVMLVVFATRPGFKAVLDFSPQRRFTLTEDSAELLANVRESKKTVVLHTVYEPLGVREGATEREKDVYVLRQSIQDLTTDLLRQYHALGGESVQVFHHDLRKDLRGIRELTRALERRIPNFVLVKVGERSRVLSLDLDLADIDFGQAGASLPGQARNPKPLLRDYKGEEAISSAIKSLLVEGNPKCYLLEGYGEADVSAGTRSSYSSLMLALEGEGFQMAKLNLAEVKEVPKDAACVALLEPRREIPDADVERLVAYLRRGGRMFLNVVYVPWPQEWNPTFDNLGRRLGFGLGEDLVCNLIPDPQHPNEPGQAGVYLVQNLEITALNPVHDLTRVLYRTGRFPTIKFAREILKSAEPPSDVGVDLSLLRTSPYSWIEERTVTGEGGERQVDWLPPRAQNVFAPRCVGAVIDVVPTEGKRSGHLVIVSGYAFHNGAFGSVNGDLALNVFQWMAERKVLVGVRGTRYQPHELTLVRQQVKRTAWLLIAGVPGALLLCGLAVLWRRSRI